VEDIIVNTISGIVKNGLIVPSVALPEGARVEICLSAPGLASLAGLPVSADRLTPSELRKMPREQRQAILAAAAALAEQDYRSDKELTDFDAFSEEEMDDDESDSRQG
jgi:hypothetical protein